MFESGFSVNFWSHGFLKLKHFVSRIETNMLYFNEVLTEI